MFCSTSYQSHNDQNCFLIKKNSSGSTLIGIPKQNSSMKASFESKTTKISLRKIHQSCVKLSLSKSLKTINEKMTRSPHQGMKIQSSLKYICNTQKKAYFDYLQKRSEPDARNIIIDNTKQDISEIKMEGVQSLRIPSLKDINSPQQTLRMQKYYSDQASNLKKTRKTIKFSQQLTSKPLRQSIVSIQNSVNYKQKLQQSLIIVDYFNPSQLKLQQLSPFIQKAITAKAMHQH